MNEIAIKTETKGEKEMEKIILYREDFKNKADGYHIDTWKEICESLNLPIDTEEIKVSYISAE
jgi:hypothetical protein